jgi:hypothetical protein
MKALRLLVAWLEMETIAVLGLAQLPAASDRPIIPVIGVVRGVSGGTILSSAKERSWR